MDPLHIRRPPHHREGAAAQGAAPLLGRGLLLQRGDRYLRIGNRLFYEDPDQAVEPSGQIVVAADAWARELARNTLSGATPTLFCTPDGQCSEAVELSLGNL